MKKLSLLLVAILFAVTGILAQTPNQFKYQAVLRDAGGQIMAEEAVTVDISILQGSASGTRVFDEQHSVTTTAQGLINLNIGSVEDLSVVDFSADTYFIEISVNSTIMGTSQLLSVPYALQAKEVENVDYLQITNTPVIPEDVADLTDNSNLLFDGDWTSLTNTPATIAGYGITDAFDGTWANLTGTAPNVSTFNNDAGYLTTYTETWTESDSDIYFNDGNVGIGTTTPVSRLTVVGNISLQDGDLELNNGYGIFTSGGLNALFYNNSFRVVYSGNPLLYVENDGNVGIGTTTPTDKFEVQGDLGSIGFPINGNNIRYKYNGVNYLQVDGASSQLNIRVNGSDRMSIKNNGNVGIGISSPVYKLDVSGDINTTGSYLVDGADFAEFFINEEELISGDIVGINLETGKIRKYQTGDELVGVVSSDAGYVGNNALDRKNDPNYTLVGLTGQLEFDQSQVIIENSIVKTKDGVKIGVLLANGKVFIK